MSEPAIHEYAQVMRELKRRIEFINYLLSGNGYTLYPETTIESVYLQLRKILELIAMASLVPNQKEYGRVHKDFGIHWNAKLLLKNLEKINPNNYPNPIKEIPSKTPDIKAHFEDLKEGFLTKNDFIHVYKKCSKVLHADNPFGRSSDYKYYQSVLPEWLSKIMVLLNTHTIKLVGQDVIWLIHMKESDDDDVHYYVFTRNQKSRS